MIKESLVSIIMPAWNCESFVKQAIESVLDQTYSDWELLVVDDCSTDSTRSIVSELASTDQRITLIEQLKNSGPACARNSALRQAKGRWIAFLDSDDIWLKNKLDHQLAFHKDCGSAISYTNFRRFVDIDSPGKYRNLNTRMTYNSLLGNTCIVTSSVIIDKKITGDFYMQKVYYDDFVCWLDILKSGNIAAGLDEDLLRYRVTQGSVSRNKVKSAVKVWGIYRKNQHLGFFKSVFSLLKYGARGMFKYSSL